MKPLENIFSKKPTKKGEVCPNPKNPIIIDIREKQSLIAANLLEQRANIKFETLEIGDYLIGEVIVERKTFSDFISSMIDKRLQDQLINLKKCPKPVLILEGNSYNSKINSNAIKGMLISLATDFQIPIIPTKDERETSEFLILLAKRYENSKSDYSTRHNKTPKTLEKNKQFILEGFPGIGPTTSKKLLKEFPSLNQIFNASKEELEKCGMNEDKIKKFRQLLDEKP